MLNERFQNVEDAYFLLKSHLATGRVTAEQFNTALFDLVFEHEGRYWMIGANSSKWKVYDGQKWNLPVPPPSSTPASRTVMPASETARPADETAASTSSNAEQNADTSTRARFKPDLRESKRIVGIDLGTTKSVIALIEESESGRTGNARRLWTIPSVVAYSESEGWIVGHAAKQQAMLNPENTFHSINRFLGCKYKEVENAVSHASFNVIPDAQGNVKFRCPIIGKQVSPEEILAKLLARLLQEASTELGERITQAVITVPASFNELQCRAIVNACEIVGVQPIRILRHSIAIAVAYGRDHMDLKADENVLIFDFGAGSLSISVCEVGCDVVVVKSIIGDTNLGGDNWDQAIVDWMTRDFKKDYGIDLSKDKIALQRMKAAAEEAKIDLSTTTETHIELPFIASDQSGPRHLVANLNRSTFDQLGADILQNALALCRAALKDAELEAHQIGRVILSGGSARIPKVRQMVSECFRCKTDNAINRDEIVALGAAIQAGVFMGRVKDMLLLDVIPFSLGVEAHGGMFIEVMHRNTTIPERASKIFSTAVDGQSYVDIHVLQGEKAMAKENTSLVVFRLEGVSPASRGAPRIEITFDIDASSSISVCAKDLGSGREKKISLWQFRKEDCADVVSDLERMLPQALPA